MRSLGLVVCALLIGCGGGDAPRETPGSAGAAGAAGAAGKPSTPPPSVELAGISVTQVTDVTVMRDGAAVASTVAPVVEAKPGFFRLHVKPSKGFGFRPVLGEVTITQEDGAVSVHAVTSQVSRPSTEGDPSSTLNVPVPTEAFRLGATYSARLALNGEEQARFPAEGAAPIGVEHVSDGMKVVLVPFRYDADGSGRLPDVGALAEPFRLRMAAMYPAPSVELVVHEPVPYPKALGPMDDDEWGAYLDALLELRDAEAAPPNVYYYAVMAPRKSFGQFCGGGCIAGLALGSMGKKTDPSNRGAVGIGYDDGFSEDTFVHEIGHTHGILHAPCGGPASVDKKFPYPDGTIGVAGYDAQNEVWLHGDDAHDVMGYCENRWVSDYVYGKLAREMQVVAASTAMAHVAPTTWVRARVDLEGELVASSAREIPLRVPVEELGVAVRVRLGGTQVAARYAPFEDVRGGYVYLPKGSVPRRGDALVVP